MATTGADRWPDTLNLEGHASLALNFLTRNLDSPRSSFPYRPSLYGRLDYEPPRSYHHFEDHQDMAGRMLDAIILARQMTGSTLNAEVDEKLESMLLSYIWEDGLYHSPKAPWTWRQVAEYPDVVFIPGHHSVFYGLASWFLQSGESKCQNAMESLVSGLHRIAVKRGEHCYFPSIFYLPHKGWEPEEEPVGRKQGLSTVRWTGVAYRPLIRYLAETRSPNVDRFVSQWINWIVDRAGEFGEDGSFSGHVHSATTMACGMLEYGQLPAGRI